MGDCYSAVLRVKLRENQRAAAVQKMLRQWMREEARGTDASRGVRWSLSELRRKGVRPDTFGGICKVLLAFNQGDARHRKDGDGFDVYCSGFNASYRWFSVMVRAFFKMAWALEEGSYLEIDRDGGHDVYEARNGDSGLTEVWENHRPPCEAR